jgi:hypothetical protein
MSQGRKNEGKSTESRGSGVFCRLPGLYPGGRWEAWLPRGRDFSLLAAYFFTKKSIRPKTTTGIMISMM